VKNTRYLTEGAVLLALFSVMLLVSLYIPLLGGFFSLLLGVPFVVFTARHGWKNAIPFFVGSLILTGLFGTVFLIPLTFAFGLGGAAIGELYKREKSRYSILMGGTVIFSVSLVLLFVMTSVFANINMLTELQTAFEESMQTTEKVLGSLGQEPSEQQMELLEQSFQTIQYLLPSFLVILGFILAFLTQWVSVPILKKMGYAIEKFPPLRNFRLPKSLLWYYLAVLVLSFLEMERGSFLYISVLNVSQILQLLMVVQGYAFLFYYFHQKSVGKWVPVLIVVLTLALPFFLQFIRILGIIDLGFDLRKQKNKES
jgi:uncharacterized protein YybS (DUF2232 family)